MLKGDWPNQSIDLPENSPERLRCKIGSDTGKAWGWMPWGTTRFSINVHHFPIRYDKLIYFGIKLRTQPSGLFIFLFKTRFLEVIESNIFLYDFQSWLICPNSSKFYHLFIHFSVRICRNYFETWISIKDSKLQFIYSCLFRSFHKSIIKFVWMNTSNLESHCILKRQQKHFFW